MIDPKPLNTSGGRTAAMGPLTTWALVIAALAIGLAVVQFALVQRDYVTAWTFAKPVSLVELAQETGRLSFGPFESPEPWIEETYEAHSRRWGTTVLFVALSDITGAEVQDLAWASPLGVAPFLLALLFLFSRFGWAKPSVRAAFALAALGFVLNYQMIIWFYHGGGWPGTSLAFLMIGALFAFEMTSRGRWIYAAAAIAFLLLQFPIYHSTAVISFMLLAILAGYALLLRLATALRAPASPAHRQIRRRFDHYSNLAIIGSAMVFIDPIFGFMLEGLGPIVQSPGSTFSNFFVSYFEGDNFFNPNFTGFEFGTRVALMAPLLYMLVAATLLWLWDVYRFLRAGETAEGQLVAHALYLTAVVTMASSLMFGGSPRATEPYFFVILAFPLLLFRPWRALPPGPRVSGSRAALALGVVLVTAGSLVVVLRDPYTSQADTTATEAAAGRWAARNADISYFADAKLANLALIEDPETPVLAPLVNGVTIRELQGVFYAGPAALAEGLRARGARLALLSERNIEGHGHAKPALFMINEPIRALPDYNFQAAGFGTVYDNGAERVLLFPEP